MLEIGAQASMKTYTGEGERERQLERERMGIPEHVMLIDYEPQQ